MPHETPSVHLCQRFSSLIWACLDADLHKSALFYAERYYVIDTSNHDGRHLYATALLRSGQAHSALYFISTGGATESRCTGCLEIKSRCCTALGRHRQAREALDASMRDSAYTPSRTLWLIRVYVL